MAVRDGKKHSRSASARRYGVAMGGALSALVAAAAMATASAAPAKADFEDLIDPIIQPLLTSFTDSLSAIDPAAAVDLTSWSDSLMASLNSIDVAAPAAAESVAAPAAAESAAASAASAEPAASSTTGTYDIPITVQEGTEPTVGATVDGASTTDLVDTGSSGLVIPWEDLGSSSELADLESLGLPSGIGVDGYSGGVQFLYLTYDNLPVDYGGVLSTSAPVDVEVFSWPSALSSGETLQQYFNELFDNGAFTSFLNGNNVNGILGVGDYQAGFLGTGSEAGPTESPLQAAGFTGVTVDVPQSELIVSDSNPGTVIDTLNGAPTPTSDLTETVTNSSGTAVGSATVSDDVDSGGVYGSIPSSLGPVPNGDTISVYDGNTELYSYTVDNNGVDNAPTVLPAGDTVSGVTAIDSGFPAFQNEPVYIDYANGTISFDSPPPAS
jgi:hypothetical protein